MTSPNTSSPPRTLRLVLGDQLTSTVSSLRDVADGDVVVMAEVMEEASYVPHHKKKLAFVFASMRHFADELRADGVAVHYVRLDDRGNTGTVLGEVERALSDPAVTKQGLFDRLVATKAGEYRLTQAMARWPQRLGQAYDIAVELREDDRFLCSTDEFSSWATGRKALRMEYFYREMRRKHDVLMDGDKPVGGQWNYDADNRKAIDDTYTPPHRQRFVPDAVTGEVIDLVAQHFADNFGDLDGFDWAVTRADAQAALDHFIGDCLPTFGDYQDAMAAGEPFLSHGLISFYLNIGLLDPLACCRAAEAAYEQGDAPLNAVEGFVRQILGWREYVRGIYWQFMPEYKTLNALGADRPLPDFYWTGETDMACMADAITQTKRHAYAHHIQRLMVTGNFAMLAGVAPDPINEWYMAVYADAYEWVELPNTHGMAIFADGGIMASKPYAASGAYINRMSNYCGGCRYKVAKKNGPDACPFNYLYWDFLARNEDALRKNPRIGRIYGTWDRMTDERKQAVRDDTARFLHRIGLGQPVPNPSHNVNTEPAQ